MPAYFKMAQLKGNDAMKKTIKTIVCGDKVYYREFMVMLDNVPFATFYDLRKAKKAFRKCDWKGTVKIQSGSYSLRKFNP